MLKAIGKMIDTLPIEKLFSQEEIRADRIVIEVDRFYGDYDLTEFTFIMRGVTESGGETESVLTVTESDETIIRLLWEVGKEFTTESGKLSLDLFACHYVENTDPIETDALIRYQLPPVQVRALPDAEHPLDSHSYTEFLLQVRNAAEENLTEINAIVEQFRSDFSVARIDERLETLETDTSAELQRLSNLTQYHDNTLRSYITPQLYKAQDDIEALQEMVRPIVVLTQAQYDAIESPSQDTLYVIVG